LGPAGAERRRHAIDAADDVGAVLNEADALEMFFAALFGYFEEGAEQAARAARGLARSPSIATG
jgi:hypothetical protein